MTDWSAREQLDPAERAKARLNAYRDKQKDIDFMVERLARMASMMDTPGTPTLSDMPRSPGYSDDRLADQVARKIELEEAIRLAMADERAEYEAIKLITSHMAKAEERAIIRLRYLDGAKWSEICSAIFGQRDDFSDKVDGYMSQTFRIHSTALVSFSEEWDRSKC